MENSIVWYRSRKFWAIVYALMLAWSVALLITSFPLFREGYWLFFDLSSVLGGGIFLLLFGDMLGITLASFYLLTFGYVIFTIAITKNISIILNTTVFAVYILNQITIFAFLGGLT